jgi:hypothetical protein
MRFIVALAAVVVVIVASGLISKSEAIMTPTKSVSFTERWTPVDEALQSGRFAVKDAHDK